MRTAAHWSGRRDVKQFVADPSGSYQSEPESSPQNAASPVVPRWMDGGNLIMQNLTLFGVAAAQGKPVAGLHSCDENQWFVDSKLLLFRRLQEGKFASEPFSG